jgi:fatty-acyl-CoA synthase
MEQIRTLSDIEAIERVPLAERQLPESTYAMIRQSALTSPDHPALVFFPDGEHYRANVFAGYVTEVLSAVLPAHLSWEVQVGPNQQHGMLATLMLSGIPEEQRADIHEQIARTLGGYVVKYQIHWS